MNGLTYAHVSILIISPVPAIAAYLWGRYLRSSPRKGLRFFAGWIAASALTAFSFAPQFWLYQLFSAAPDTFQTIVFIVQDLVGIVVLFKAAGWLDEARRR